MHVYNFANQDFEKKNSRIVWYMPVFKLTMGSYIAAFQIVECAKLFIRSFWYNLKSTLMLFLGLIGLKFPILDSVRQCTNTDFFP